jgi:hypothetical protein
MLTIKNINTVFIVVDFITSVQPCGTWNCAAQWNPFRFDKIEQQ